MKQSVLHSTQQTPRTKPQRLEDTTPSFSGKCNPSPTVRKVFTKKTPSGFMNFSKAAKGL
jgi:hypothetical protein